MPARQISVLAALAAVVAVVIAIVFFASSHPLRGIVLLVLAGAAAVVGVLASRAQRGGGP